MQLAISISLQSHKLGLPVQTIFYLFLSNGSLHIVEGQKTSGGRTLICSLEILVTLLP